MQQLTASFHLNLTAFGLLSFLVGLFIVHSAIGLAFEQRLPMLRTLRACGVSARELVVVLVGELVLLALAAGIGGVVCGYLIASALLPQDAATRYLELNAHNLDRWNRLADDDRHQVAKMIASLAEMDAQRTHSRPVATSGRNSN